MDRSNLRIVIVVAAALGTGCDAIVETNADGGSTGGGSDANGASSTPTTDAAGEDDGGGGGDGGASGGPLPTTCDNSIRDGDETDVDCGGSCGGCELSERCTVAADCLSETCAIGLCRAAGLYVFDDGYAPGATYSPYTGQTGTVAVDNTEYYVGTASLRVDVPGSGYNGASLQAPTASLDDYDALVFWAKASADKTLDVVGFGADGTGDTGDTLRVERKVLALTASWTRFIVPIPNPSRMTSVVDHFSFAEGSDEGAYSIWFDEVRFARLGDLLGAPQVELQGGPAALTTGGELQVSAPTVSYTIEGSEFSVQAGIDHFDFESSDDDVATVDAKGKVMAVAQGQAGITSSLRGVQATGMRVITVSAARPAAPLPTQAAEDVISLFSGAYSNETVDTFSAAWDSADVADDTAGGNAVKLYTKLVYAGIEFTSKQINASSMNTLHVDVWTPDAAELKIKLVDFGANAAYGDGMGNQGDDSEHELTLNASSSPPLTTGSWVSFDVPLSSFTGLAARAHLAQLVLSAKVSNDGPATVYLDNLYFWRAPIEPRSAAPTPTEAPSSVISLFSGAYTNVTVDTFSASWDSADVTEVTIESDVVKQYTNLVYAGIEFTSSTVNATSMDTLHLDVWSPDAAVVKVNVVDFGANGAYGGGDDRNHELILNASSSPPLATGSWVSFDLPLASFTGLTTRAHLAQLVLSGASATNGKASVYVDNIYFFDAP